MARGNNVGVCYGDKCPLSCSPSLGQTWPVLCRLKSQPDPSPERWTLSLTDKKRRGKINKYNLRNCSLYACVCLREKVSVWNSLNGEDLAGRAERSVPVRVGALGEEM